MSLMFEFLVWKSKMFLTLGEHSTYRTESFKGLDFKSSCNFIFGNLIQLFKTDS